MKFASERPPCGCVSISTEKSFRPVCPGKSKWCMMHHIFAHPWAFCQGIFKVAESHVLTLTKHKADNYLHSARAWLESDPTDGKLLALSPHQGPQPLLTRPPHITAVSQPFETCSSKKHPYKHSLRIHEGKALILIVESAVTQRQAECRRLPV